MVKAMSESTIFFPLYLRKIIFYLLYEEFRFHKIAKIFKYLKVCFFKFCLMGRGYPIVAPGHDFYDPGRCWIPAVRRSRSCDETNKSEACDLFSKIQRSAAAAARAILLNVCAYTQFFQRKNWGGVSAMNGTV
jgi:hypothetical protein